MCSSGPWARSIERVLFRHSIATWCCCLPHGYASIIVDSFVQVTQSLLMELHSCLCNSGSSQTSSNIGRISTGTRHLRYDLELSRPFEFFNDAFSSINICRPIVQCNGRQIAVLPFKILESRTSNSQNLHFLRSIFLTQNGAVTASLLAALRSHAVLELSQHILELLSVYIWSARHREVLRAHKSPNNSAKQATYAL